MTLATELEQHIRAGFSGIWIRSSEHNEAAREIASLCHKKEWSLIEWDADRGVITDPEHGGDSDSDPIPALKALRETPCEGALILVMRNLSMYLDDPELVQVLENTIHAGKSSGRFVVALSHTSEIRREIEKSFVVLEHNLPDREQLLSIAAELEKELPEPAEVDRLIDSACGLTAMEAEGAYALSWVKNGRFDPSVVWNIKAGSLKKAGTLELYRGEETFDDLGGLDSMKDFCVRALAGKNGKAKAKGVLLLGVPGAGKSAFAKALGNETGRPTITLDFGALMGSLVGQTEERTREALKIVDRMAPCILFVDEIEKGLAGATDGGGDSGVSSRMLGTLLTWLNDHESDVFFVGTCNDIEALSGVSAGAFTRAERFDGIFFIDLPDDNQRQVIWEMYRQAFGVKGDESYSDVNDDGWTGAEIKACCRMAALLGVTIAEASSYVVPVCHTASSQITNLRAWADGRAIDANRKGIYRQQPAEIAGKTNGKGNGRRALIG